MPLTPVLTKRWLSPRSWTLETYEKLEGYQGLRKALGLHPDEIIQLVKDSGLRGRGGAGFPTGMKWGFLAKGTGKPTYLVVNADESEPGTFKDMELLERDPHALVEGVIVSAYAIGCNTAFVYLRGECGFAGRRLEAAIGEAAPRLAGRKPDEVTEVPTAFPAQSPAPSLTEDPTTRPVEELRTGADHGGARPDQDGREGEAP